MSGIAGCTAKGSSWYTLSTGIFWYEVDAQRKYLPEEKATHEGRVTRGLRTGPVYCPP